MVLLCIAVKISSSHQTHTSTPNNLRSRPEIFESDLVSYEQFSELSSNLQSRYHYDTGCILSGVKVKFAGKKQTVPSQLAVKS
jgi:hypothetical protein